MSSDPPHDPAAFNAADAEVAADAVRRGFVPLHAAAVEIDDAIVALSGPSGSGKSTLAAAAVLDGNRYVADEITAVSPDDRRVLPYHRPIGLRVGGSEALGVEFPDNRRNILGAIHPFPVDEPERASPGGQLAMIVLVRWRPGDTSLTSEQPSAALAELAQHVVVDDDAIPMAFRALETLVRAVPVVRLTYGVPAEGVQAVREEIRSWTR